MKVLSTLLSLSLFSYAAAYFKSCISQTDLDELNIEIIRNALYKVHHVYT